MNEAEQLADHDFNMIVDGIVKSYIREGGDGFCPNIMGMDPERNTHGLPMWFKDDNEKDLLLKRIRLYFMRHDISHYILGLETWAVVAEPTPEQEELRKTKGLNAAVQDYLKKLDSMRPSEHPDKKEVLMFVSVTKQRKRTRYYEILRNKEGRAILTAFAMPDCDSGGESTLEGPMMDLLPTKSWSSMSEGDKAVIDFTLSLGNMVGHAPVKMPPLPKPKH